MPRIQLLRVMLENGLIDQIDMSPETIATVLDRRDKADFDESWILAHTAVQNDLKRLRKSECDEIQELRKIAYLLSFKRWNSSDLSALISDDIGLIAEAIMTDSTNPWINGLLHSYKSHSIPCDAALHKEGAVADSLRMDGTNT